MEIMMQKNKTIFTLFILLCGSLLYSGQTWAVNGDQRIGLSATQYGMAGATTALPEDSAALLLNPAAILGLEVSDVRLDVGFSLLNPPRSVNGQESDSNLYFLPTGGAVFKINPQLNMGLAMSGTAGFGVDVPDAFPVLPGNQAIVTQREMFVFAPGFAYQVSDQFSLGASLNICNQSLALSSPQFTLPQNRRFGFGATLGATYRLSPAWKLGLSYVSEKKIDEHEFNTSDGKIELDMHGPAMLAFGIAFQTSSSLVVEADLKYIFFSDVRDRIQVQRPQGYSGNVPPVLQFGWRDQTVFALGIRKMLGDSTIVRAGINYGKSPIDEEDVDNNLGSIAIVEKHFSLGFSRYLNENLIINAAYTHAFENELTSPSTGTTIKVKQHWLHMQISYAF
jgi:long-chain fatty acid transport protein